MNRGQTALASFGFVAVVAAIAGASIQFGAVPVGLGLTAGAGGFFVGVLFVVRDLLHQWLSTTKVTALVVALGLTQLLALGNSGLSQTIVVANVMTLIVACSAQATFFAWSKRQAEREECDFGVGSWCWLRAAMISSVVCGIALQTFLFWAFTDVYRSGEANLWGSVLIKSYGVGITVAASVVGAYFFNRRESRISRTVMGSAAYAPVVPIRSRSRVA